MSARDLATINCEITRSPPQSGEIVGDQITHITNLVMVPIMPVSSELFLAHAFQSPRKTYETFIFADISNVLPDIGDGDKVTNTDDDITYIIRGSSGWTRDVDGAFLHLLVDYVEMSDGDGGGGQSSLLSGLQAYWKLDEESGQRLDVVNAHHLTDNNTVGFVTGKQNNAASFVAANSEYLSINSTANIEMGNIDFTIAVWVRLISKTANMHIVSKYDNTGADKREYHIRYNQTSDRFVFSISSDGRSSTVATVENSTGLTTDVWYLVIVYHDAVNDVIGIVVDNGVASTTAVSSGVFAADSPLHIGAIGRATAGVYLDGYVDECGIWKRLLTDAEKTTLYNSGNGVTHPSFGG